MTYKPVTGVKARNIIYLFNNNKIVLQYRYTNAL